jgi:hypothetical protein
VDHDKFYGFRKDKKTSTFSQRKLKNRQLVRAARHHEFKTQTMHDIYRQTSTNKRFLSNFVESFATTFQYRGIIKRIRHRQ